MAVKTTKKKKMVKGTTIVKPEDIDEAHKYFNLQRVISDTRIQSDKVYNNMKGAYNSLSGDERKQIATCLMGPVVNLFKRLGMQVSFSKLQETQGDGGK
jgi:hypothetical protein